MKPDHRTQVPYPLETPEQAITKAESVLEDSKIPGHVRRYWQGILIDARRDCRQSTGSARSTLVTSCS